MCDKFEGINLKDVLLDNLRKNKINMQTSTSEDTLRKKSSELSLKTTP